MGTSVSAHAAHPHQRSGVAVGLVSRLGKDPHFLSPQSADEGESAEQLITAISMHNAMTRPITLHRSFT